MYDISFVFCIKSCLLNQGSSENGTKVNACFLCVKRKRLAEIKEHNPTVQ